MSMALINHLLQSYGYLAVFLFVALESVGVPLPGETALIAAALYAGSAHRLNVGLIALVAALAAIAGDNGGYWLGQYGGTRLVRRYGHWVRLDARKLKVGRTCSPATAARWCSSDGSSPSCAPTPRSGAARAVAFRADLRIRIVNSVWWS